MELEYLLTLASRWLHILAAITAVGGTIFARFALLPATAILPEEQRAALLEEIRRRWSKWVMGAIGFLLISGLYNVVHVFRFYDMKHVRAYHILLLVKILLAFAIFYIASLLTGRSATAQRFRANGRRWLSVNVTLAVTLVCISGIMRSLPHEPKGPRPNVPAQLDQQGLRTGVTAAAIVPRG